MIKNMRGDKSWTGYEMVSFESPSVSRKGNKADFVSLRMGEKEDAAFIPLEQGGDFSGKRREADDILKEAHGKSAMIEQEAYEKGFSQGEKDGLELGEKKALKVIENIENLFIELSRMKNEIIRQHEREIVGLIFAIAKRIIQHRIESDEGIVKEVVFKAIELAPEKSEVTLRVNPEDFDYIEKQRPEFFTKFSELKSITITSDSSITRGGCLLETPYGDADARIETQLERVYQSLEGAGNLKT
jgi:flagellar assembly protein FliH